MSDPRFIYSTFSQQSSEVNPRVPAYQDDGSEIGAYLPHVVSIALNQQEMRTDWIEESVRDIDQVGRSAYQESVRDESLEDRVKEILIRLFNQPELKVEDLPREAVIGAIGADPAKIAAAALSLALCLPLALNFQVTSKAKSNGAEAELKQENTQRVEGNREKSDSLYDRIKGNGDLWSVILMIRLALAQTAVESLAPQFKAHFNSMHGTQDMPSRA